MGLTSRRTYAITLRKALFYMKSQGYDPAVLLAGTGLTQEDLSDSYNFVSEEQARSYYLNLVGAVNCDGVGLEIGWRTGLADMGLHGMAMLTERTAGEALKKTWELRDNYNLLAEWQYRVAGNLIIFTVSSIEQNPKLRVFLIERVMATIMANVEEIFGEESNPLRVSLDYSPPSSVDKYKEIFRCPLRFSQEQSQIYYPLAWADVHLDSHDPQTRELLGVLRADIHNKLRSGDDIVHSVKLALRRSAPGEFPNLEQVASELAMSSRTLHRKLGQQNVHFQSLLDAERRQLAEDLLSNTETNIQKISEQCGFADSHNFSQAFRRWTGMSPSEFRSSRD